MTLFQILIVLFIAAVLYKALKRFAKKEISLWLLLLWSIFWIGLGVVALFPIIIEQLALLVGVGRGVDLVIYLALFTCFYILFKLMIKQQKLEKDFVTLVRKIAIDKAKIKK